MADRRSVLIGLGSLITGGGALFGTGAFTTVTAERSVSVQTAGDPDALLGLEPADRSGFNPPGEGDGPAGGPPGDPNPGGDPPPFNNDNPYVETVNGVIQIDLGSLNPGAVLTFRNLVRVTNQGTEPVTTLSVEFTETPDSIDPSATFDFPVDDVDSDGQDIVDSGDILTGENGIPSQLSTGEAVIFGIKVDLQNGGRADNTLPNDGTYTLTVTAQTD